jgi:hypothetical protein
MRVNFSGAYMRCQKAARYMNSDAKKIYVKGASRTLQVPIGLHSLIGNLKIIISAEESKCFLQI